MDQELVSRFMTDLKGGIGEALVTMLFRSSGYNVKLFGRWKAAHLSLKSWEEDLSAKDKTDHPDLVIRRNITVELIEVKYRAWGHLNLTHDSNQKLLRQCHFWSHHARPRPFKVVIINDDRPPFFEVLLPPYVKGNEFIDRIPLTQAGWEIDPIIYEQCVWLLGRGLFHAFD